MGQNMEYVTEFNFLGLMLDSHLNWKAHVSFTSVNNSLMNELAQLTDIHTGNLLKLY